MKITSKKLIRLLRETADPSWTPFIDQEAEKPYWKKISAFLRSVDATIYPSEENIFAALKWCSLSALKVIILGQDPYINPGQAHGLCFSVKGTKDMPEKLQIPPTLRNIYKVLQRDIPGFVPPNHAYLVSWAQQGILMLNSCLTVTEGESGSHINVAGWENFTNNLLSFLCSEKKDLVFLCWGKPAEKLVYNIDKRKHYMMFSSHPSPLGWKQTDQPFEKCTHFSRTNEILNKLGRGPINWSLPEK